MSISSVSWGGSPAQSLLQQRRTDLQSLAKAVQSGDIKSAQSALTAYQGDVQKLNPQQSGTGLTYSRNPTLQTDLSNLATAVQGGSVTDAQTALSTTQQDRTAATSQNGQSSASTVSSFLQDLAKLLQDVQGGDTASAQSDAATVTDDLQNLSGGSQTDAASGHHHHHRGGPAPTGDASSSANASQSSSSSKQLK